MLKRAIMRDNKIAAENIQFPLSNIFQGESLTAVLTDVRPRFHYDENKKKTNIIEAFVYTVTDRNTFASFNVKVNSSSPAITKEELAAAEEHVFVKIPLEETIVKPFKLEYGVATVSIVAPYITLVTDSEESEEN